MKLRKPLRLKTAIYTGFAGSITLSIAMFFLRMAGIPIHLERLLAAAFFPSLGYLDSWFFGFGLHLLIGAGWAILFGITFRTGIWKPNWWIGLVGGVFQGIIAGLLFGIFTQLHPLIPDDFPPYGYYMMGMGLEGVAIFMLGHMLFGVVVGGLYKIIDRRAYASRSGAQTTSPPEKEIRTSSEVNRTEVKSEG